MITVVLALVVTILGSLGLMVGSWGRTSMMVRMIVSSPSRDISSSMMDWLVKQMLLFPVGIVTEGGMSFAL